MPKIPVRASIAPIPPMIPSATVAICEGLIHDKSQHLACQLRAVPCLGWSRSHYDVAGVSGNVDSGATRLSVQPAILLRED